MKPSGPAIHPDRCHGRINQETASASLRSVFYHILLHWLPFAQEITVAPSGITAITWLLPSLIALKCSQAPALPEPWAPQASTRCQPELRWLQPPWGHSHPLSVPSAWQSALSACGPCAPALCATAELQGQAAGVCGAGGSTAARSAGGSPRVLRHEGLGPSLVLIKSLASTSEHPNQIKTNGMERFINWPCITRENSIAARRGAQQEAQGAWTRMATASRGLAAPTPAVGMRGPCHPTHCLGVRSGFTWRPGAPPASGLPSPANRAASHTLPHVCCPARTPTACSCASSVCQLRKCRRASLRRPQWGQEQGHHRSPPRLQGFGRSQGTTVPNAGGCGTDHHPRHMQGSVCHRHPQGLLYSQAPYISTVFIAQKHLLLFPLCSTS